jgi:hypothetical protein
VGDDGISGSSSIWLQPERPDVRRELVVDPLGAGLLGMPHCRATFHRVGR